LNGDWKHISISDMNIVQTSEITHWESASSTSDERGIIWIEWLLWLQHNESIGKCCCLFTSCPNDSSFHECLWNKHSGYMGRTIRWWISNHQLYSILPRKGLVMVVFVQLSSNWHINRWNEDLFIPQEWIDEHSVSQLGRRRLRTILNLGD
jgi:hypothetical protein